MTANPVSDTPIDDGVKKESVRLHGVLGRLVRLPLPFLRMCWRLLKRLFVTPPSPAELRAADKKYQAEVRRELRGLPRTHDAGRPVP